MFQLVALKVQAVSGDALANVDKSADDEGQEVQSFVSHFCRREDRLLGFIAHSDTKTKLNHANMQTCRVPCSGNENAYAS